MLRSWLLALLLLCAASLRAQTVQNATLRFPLLAPIPHDPYLADDSFAARAPTLRAVDALLRALA